jgi:hypothetical protein
MHAGYVPSQDDRQNESQQEAGREQEQAAG